MLAREETDPGQAIDSVAEQFALFELRFVGRPLARHPDTDAILKPSFVRPSDGNEAATTIAKARLHRASNGSRLDVCRGVRITELRDPDVLLSLPRLEARKSLEEPSKRGRTFERAN